LLNGHDSYSHIFAATSLFVPVTACDFSPPANQLTFLSFICYRPPIAQISRFAPFAFCPSFTSFACPFPCALLRVFTFYPFATVEPVDELIP
jgi:hypothetical protein